MTKKTRTKLFLFFIIIFLIITPLVALYAAGYKLNLTWPININDLVQKTGMLIIKTNPGNAKIIINEKPQELFFKKYFSKEEVSYIRTPAKIKNLLPDIYDVRLELDGYWPWHKKLEIRPGESTLLEDVFLFKKEVPQLISEFSGTSFSQSPDKKNIAFIKNNELKINDDGDNIKTIKIKETDSNKYDILWSYDSQKIIIDSPEEKFIVDIKKEKINDLNEFIKPDYDSIKWDIYDSNKLYYKNENKIYSYNINLNEISILSENEDYVDFLVRDNYLYYISKINKTYSLKIFSLTSNEIIRIIDLPCSSELKLINPLNKYLNLLNKQHGILYIIDPLSTRNPLIEIISNIKKTEWVDENKLIYINDFEIWHYDFTENKKELLTRISDRINNISWHKSNNYIFYSTDKSVFTIELDKRERRNTNEILKFDSIFSFFLNSKNDTLFFFGKIGDKNGFYRLAI
jgi:hypothetical protein